ncbi:MAG: type II/IV secretion system protein [Candidatus Omnitrophica bacterium]|nr:type II/IV secretion system protein [Candidatus Omnitrophota bacterium]
MMEQPEEQLLKTLKNFQDINPAAIDRLIEAGHDISLVKNLLEEGIVSQENLAAVVMKEFHIPFVDLAQYHLDNSLKSVLTERSAREYQALPLSMLGNTLTVVMADPLNTKVVDDLKCLTGKDIEIAMASQKQITEVINQFYRQEALEGVLEEKKKAPMTFEILRDNEMEKTPCLNENKASDLQETSLFRLVNLVIQEALRQRATDIHIEPCLQGERVRFRIDGVLKDILTIPQEGRNVFAARIRRMAHLESVDPQALQEGCFKMKKGQQEVFFQVSFLPTTFGQKIAMRLLNRHQKPEDIQNLGFSNRAIDILQAAIEKPCGMILITGPADSGKSTTLYALLQKLNTPARHILTVEDPVVCLVDGLTQFELRTDAGINFEVGLRTVLRQSPDVLMLQEIRDAAITEMLLNASLGGKLVLSSFYTHNVLDVLSCLMDMGLDPFKLAWGVHVIASQRLYRRLCDSCKSPVEAPVEILEKFNRKLEDGTFFEAKGCEHCQQTGYVGRRAVMEVLRVDDDIRQMILKAQAPEQIIQYAKENQGMKLLFDDLIDKMCQGETSLTEVLRISSEDDYKI